MTDMLDDLAAKGWRAQAQDAAAFDWAGGARLPFWTPRRVAVWAISQFCHGERATADMCARIAGRIAGDAARACLETQRLDEERHLVLYERYLALLGARADPAGALSRAYARALGAGDVHATMLAFHVILEGESLRIQKVAEDWMPCPLFRAVSAAIARDEARHVAFGKLHLRRSLPDLPLAERLALLEWLRAMWLDAAVAVAAAVSPLGPLAARLTRPGTLEAKWRGRLADLEGAGLFAPEERALFGAA
ncbi:P-aminobenzoate N-oxygenase AurF [Rubrimonas cliftonensis]|uniref:p-aminobenzoate N-oxygenase AurF n=2 Tax=Rubrimonas cliftonensis TaxID=89524 RepID=A0A1H4E8C4_9RHOB|nr:P-aminobenzoate N-oxygenase AurF [Rubrimonas cliftonensis]